MKHTHFYVALGTIITTLSACLAFLLGHTWLTQGHGLHVFIALPAATIFLAIPLILAEKMDFAADEYIDELEDRIEELEEDRAVEVIQHVREYHEN